VDLTDLLEIVERDGFLLLSDARLPSVASLIAGGPIGGSWWGHPRGGEIYRLSNALADEPDVQIVKLVSAKVTFVHRRLWPAVASVGSSREAWQTDALSEAPLALLRLIDETGQLAWDDVPRHLPPDARSPTSAVKVLEVRLLIHASEVHTPSGAHAKNVQTWSAWATSLGLPTPIPRPEEAKRQLEAALDELNDRFAARARLPWQPSLNRSRGASASAQPAS
jgi:hypothetical protein